MIISLSATSMWIPLLFAKITNASILLSLNSFVKWLSSWMRKNHPSCHFVSAPYYLFSFFCSGTALFRYCGIRFQYCSVPVLQNFVLVLLYSSSAELCSNTIELCYGTAKPYSVTYMVLMPKWYDLCHVLTIVFTSGN